MSDTGVWVVCEGRVAGEGLVCGGEAAYSERRCAAVMGQVWCCAGVCGAGALVHYGGAYTGGDGGGDEGCRCVHGVQPCGGGGVHTGAALTRLHVVGGGQQRGHPRLRGVPAETHLSHL